MPGYKGHLVGGAGAFLILLYACKAPCTTVPTMFGWLLCSLAGSLFPDVDITSKGQKLLFRMLFGLFVMLMIMQQVHAALVVSFCSFVPLLVRHRGLFHRFWFIAILASIPVLFLYSQSPAWCSSAVYGSLFFIAGAYSHLYLDVGFKRMWRI